jgi:hypothetical protein
VRRWESSSRGKESDFLRHTRREHRRESNCRGRKFTERFPQSPLRSPHCQLLLVHASFGQNYLTVDLKVARDSRCVANRLSCAYR